MKIVYMGTPDFAVKPLLCLLEHPGYEVTLVVTQPDKPKGRSGQLQFSAVKAEALKHDLPVAQPEKVRGDSAFLEELKKAQPDLIVVAAFGQFLPEEILNLPRYGCINIHASLLPKYRGAAPIQWAVINDEKETGVTIQQMAKGMDTGDILSVSKVELAQDETGESLFEKLSEISVPLLLQTIDSIENGTVTRTAQNEKDATKAPMLSRETGLIQWGKKAREIECLVRGCYSWPGTYTFLDGKKVKIISGKAISRSETYLSEEQKEDMKGAASGSVYFTKHNLYVKCFRDKFFDRDDEIFEIYSLQLEGKKCVTADEFLRGFRFEEDSSMCFGE